MNDIKIIEEYLVLDKEKITYKIYQEERKIINNKRTLTPTYDERRKKRKENKVNVKASHQRLH